MTVSDIASRLSEQYLLATLRRDLIDTQTKINTGKKSQNFSGYSVQEVNSSITFRGVHTGLETYKDNISLARSRITIMDQTLTEIHAAAGEVRTFLLAQVQGDTPLNDITQAEAREQLDRVLNKLNVRLGDRYLFSGDDIFNPPFVDQATLDANMGAIIGAQFGTGTTEAAVTAASQLVTGAGLGYSGTVLTAQNVQVRVDDNTDIDYTMYANHPGLRDVIRAMSLVTQIPQPDPTTPNEVNDYWEMVNSAMTMLDDGMTAITTAQGELGIKNRRMDDLWSQHENLQLELENFIGDAEDADLARASIDLQSIQLQLEASYRISSDVSRLRLVNFL